MKIKGFEGDLFETKEVSIELGDEDNKTAVVFKLTALPIDFHDRMEREIPSPTPPREVIRDKKKIARDENGRPVFEYNENDPVYKRASQEAQRHQSVSMILEGLRGDDNISFDAKREDHKDPRDYYQAVYEEMKICLPMKVFLFLIEEVGKMTAVDSEQIEEAKKAFL